MANIHTQNFWRLKIGVRPKHLSQSIYRVKAGDFVLKKMTIQNTKIIKNLYPNIAKELLRWIHNT
jgi:peptidyl-tRNA hydrolase